MLDALPKLVMGGSTAYRGPGTSSLTSTSPANGSRMVMPVDTVWNSVNIRVAKVSNPTSCTVTVTIQPESSGLPSGTAVTNGTVSFTPSATGWSGTLTFPSGGPTLTANTPYWLVVTVTSSGTFDGTNYWNWYAALDQQASGSYGRQFATYTSGAWVSPPATGKWGAGWVANVTPAGGSAQSWGNPYYQSSNMTISGSTRVGMKFSVDCQTVISGVWTMLATSGSTVNSLNVKIFSDADNSQKGSTFSIARSTYWGAQTSTSAQPIILDFGAPVTLTPGAYWLSLQADANTNNWQLGYYYGDLDTGATSRGGTVEQIGTRTADSGAWTTYSPAGDGFLALLVDNQTQSGSGGGEGIIGSSIVSPLGGGVIG